MKILIVGGLGQLGIALQKVLKDDEITVVDLPEVDITIQGSIETAVETLRPEVVIHCAAFTDVEEAARNPILAFQVNALGSLNVARACNQFGAVMVHVSTNEVFSGDDPKGYLEERPLSPPNAYGRSKAAAEIFVRGTVERHYIVRTAWLFAAGGRNFIHAILAKAREGQDLRVVVDEIGNPTSAADLARALGQLIRTGEYGIYHFTNSGTCSRWVFANEILRISRMDGVNVLPVLANEYVRASIPPTYGELVNNSGAKIGIKLRPWTEALEEFLSSEG